MTAQVEVKNTSKAAQDNVAFNGVPPFSFATKAQAVRTCRWLSRLWPAFARRPPGASRSVEDRDAGPGPVGQGELRGPCREQRQLPALPQVLSVSRGASATNVSEGPVTLTVLPTALVVAVAAPLEPGAVSPGHAGADRRHAYRSEPYPEP